MIIDAHTHRYPEEVSADPEAFARRQGETHWLHLVCPQGKRSLQGWANRERMLVDMKTAEVEKAVLLGWYWENAETCVLQNEWHADWIREDPGRFIGFAGLHCGMKDPVEELKKRRDQGFQGIGECHPWVQGSSPRDEKWMRCMEFAGNEGWPVTFHVTEPVKAGYSLARAQRNYDFSPAIPFDESGAG